MAKANFKPLDLSEQDDELSRMQANIQEAFRNLDQDAEFSVKTVTSAYRVTPEDDVVLADPSRGAFVISLPDPTTITKPISLRAIGASTNVVTVQPLSPKWKINGVASLALAPMARVVSDGVSAYWQVA